MSSKAKKYLITTETHEISIVRNGQKTRGAFCSECQMQVEMLSFDTTVTVTKICAFEIFRMIQSGQIHSLETAAGHLLICRNSLKKEEKE